MAKSRKMSVHLTPDTLTGELHATLDDKLDIVRFVKVMKQATTALYDIKGWTDFEIRLLWLLIGLADAENVVRSSQGHLCELTGWRQPQMSVTVKGLIEKNLIAKVNPVGKSYWIMLNPGYFCSISDDLRKFLMKRWDELPSTEPLKPTERNSVFVEDSDNRVALKRLKKASKALQQRGVADTTVSVDVEPEAV